MKFRAKVKCQYGVMTYTSPFQALLAHDILTKTVISRLVSCAVNGSMFIWLIYCVYCVRYVMALQTDDNNKDWIWPILFCHSFILEA